MVPLSEKDKVSRINQAREFGKLALYLWYSEEGTFLPNAKKGCLLF